MQGSNPAMYPTAQPLSAGAPRLPLPPPPPPAAAHIPPPPPPVRRKKKARRAAMAAALATARAAVQAPPSTQAQAARERAQKEEAAQERRVRDAEKADRAMLASMALFERPEEQMILRVPHSLAKRIDQSLQAQRPEPMGFSIDNRTRTGNFQVGEQAFIATQVDLPCIIETHKTFNNDQFFKSGDIHHMIVVQDADAEAQAVARAEERVQEALAATAGRANAPEVQRAKRALDMARSRAQRPPIMATSGISKPTKDIVPLVHDKNQPLPRSMLHNASQRLERVSVVDIRNDGQFETFYYFEEEYEEEVTDSEDESYQAAMQPVASLPYSHVVGGPAPVMPVASAPYYGAVAPTAQYMAPVAPVAAAPVAPFFPVAPVAPAVVAPAAPVAIAPAAVAPVAVAPATAVAPMPMQVVPPAPVAPVISPEVAARLENLKADLAAKKQKVQTGERNLAAVVKNKILAARAQKALAVLQAEHDAAAEALRKEEELL